jgi:hypothetical protein
VHLVLVTLSVNEVSNETVISALRVLIAIQHERMAFKNEMKYHDSQGIHIALLRLLDNLIL